MLLRKSIRQQTGTAGFDRAGGCSPPEDPYQKDQSAG